MPAYTITPEDILFFRDGRPMETAGGHGARWPEPSVIFDALHAAFHRAFPSPQPWEHSHRYARSSDHDPQRDRTQRFGSLATAGPFPALVQPPKPQWLFSRPLDVTAKDSLAPTMLPMQNPGGRSDLSTPLRYPLASLAEPSKDEPSPWWTKQAIEAYLRGGSVPTTQRWHYGENDLFAREWLTGIGIDPATQTTGRGEAEGQIYAAQYLRLRYGVSLGIHATMPVKTDQPAQHEERLTEFLPANRTLIVGGQQRVCQVEEFRQAGQPVTLDQLLPVSPAVSGERVKWLLLSPAVFPAIPQGEVRRPDGTTASISPHPGGWLPNWIAPADGFRAVQGDKTVEVAGGQVLLKADIRRDGQSRDAWRQRVRTADFLDCRLVAARIPKPMVLTGWTEAVHLKDTPWQRKHGPRPTLLAVPTGAVYYFEGKDAAQLAEVLAWHGAARANASTIRNRRSTLLGEKGYGLGVCGTWKFYEAGGSA